MTFFFLEKARSGSDVSTHSKSRSSSKEEADEDSESSGKDELTPKMKANVKKDILRLVINLSSAVASKTTQQDIIAYVVIHAWVCLRDVCQNNRLLRCY